MTDEDIKGLRNDYNALVDMFKEMFLKWRATEKELDRLRGILDRAGLQAEIDASYRDGYKDAQAGLSDKFDEIEKK
jgi:tRNA C32,U32 (ribose-2'-O)-methylase TrmJ